MTEMTLTEVTMLMIFLIAGNSIVSFTLLVLIERFVFGISWDIAAPMALIATIVGHWIGLLWLFFLHK